MDHKPLLTSSHSSEFGQELLGRASEIEQQEERDVRERALAVDMDISAPNPEERVSALDPSVGRRLSFQPLAGDTPIEKSGSPDINRTCGPGTLDRDAIILEQSMTSPDLLIEEQAIKSHFPTSANDDSIKLPKSGIGFYGADFQQKAKSITSSSTSRKEYRRLKARQARLKDNLLVRSWKQHRMFACRASLTALQNARLPSPSSRCMFAWHAWSS